MLGLGEGTDLGILKVSSGWVSQVEKVTCEKTLEGCLEEGKKSTNREEMEGR